jgi:two-component system, NtrC family, sensor kinase
MKRSAIVITLAVAALALLVSVAFKSRPVPTDVHIAQNEIAAELKLVGDDFATLVATLDSAWRETQAPSEGARALAERVGSSPERLLPPVSLIPGNSAQRSRIENSYQSFATAVDESDKLAAELIESLSLYARSAAYLRDQGPQLVERMREIRLDRVAADTFQLIVGTVDFARPDTTIRDFDLQRLLVTLRRDRRVDANMPSEMQRLLGSVETILVSKSDIQSKLEQLAESSLPMHAANLQTATHDTYVAAITSVDRARLMLAVYAAMLMASVGYIAFRLQHSYRELNRANLDLAELNESLEIRVQDRTRELEGTLYNLKESQVQLVQAEKMSSLGQLVAGISHEINTPLLYLTNNAELLQERTRLMKAFVAASVKVFNIRPNDFAERADYQQQFAAALRELRERLIDDEIEASVEEADDLAHDSIEGLKDLTEMAQSLKDFSRLDRAPVARFDVHAGLDKTLIIARNIVKHKADIRKFYAELPEIECSPSQINQVFLNLITNAAQAIEERGEIVISTKQPDDEHVGITISDNGCGISEENLAKIRDPFFTTKEVGTGTGLGLSIVDEIIRNHGGELRIESEVGEGSAFTVILPIKHTPPAASDQETDAELDLSGDEEETDLERVREQLADLAKAV